MSKRDDSIQMAVGGLTLDPVTKTPIVILKDTDNKLNLPFWIGLSEATAMATEIEGIKMARPMPHDLLKNIRAEVGGSVYCVEIAVDSRPSDAIALALRTNTPIYVAKAVLEASSILQQNEEGREQPDVANV